MQHKWAHGCNVLEIIFQIEFMEQQDCIIKIYVNPSGRGVIRRRR